MNQESGQSTDERNLSNNYSLAPNTNQHPDNMQIKELCKRHMNHYVMGHLHDGTILEGIIVDVDDEAVTILVVDKDAMNRSDEENRQFGRPPGFFRFRPFRFPFPFFRPPFFVPFVFPFFWI